MTKHREKKSLKGFTLQDILHHHKGAALSLAIAKEIIEQHGGTITCGRAENGGSIFKIVLAPTYEL